MESKKEHIKACLPELFEIALINLELARSIYSKMPKDFFSIIDLRLYLESHDENAITLSAEIIMDCLEQEMSTRDLLMAQFSRDSLVRARSRVIATQRDPRKSEFQYLVDFQDPYFCREAAYLARELLMIGFGGKLKIELLFDFLKSEDENVRAMAERLILASNANRFSIKKLFWYSEHGNQYEDTVTSNQYEAIVAAKVLLQKFPEKLDSNTLIRFQNFENDSVRVLSRKYLLEMSEDEINWNRISFKMNEGSSYQSDVATELMIKHYGHTFSGKEIIDFQKSKNPSIRGMAKDLALSLPISKFAAKTIGKAVLSTNPEISSLGKELHKIYCTFQPMDSEVSNFLEKYSLL